MKVVLVYNAKSGGYSSLKDLQKVFEDSSIQIIKTIKIEPRFEVALRPYIQKGEIIAVVGGDGSISAVAHLLKDSNAILMPLPGGTLNHFTKDLGVPQSFEEAIIYFKSAKKSKIDVGQINDKTFINNSSLGIYSDSLLDRDEHEKKIGKWPAMIFSVFTALFRFRTYKVELDGKKYTTPLIFVGNNLYELNGLTFQRSQLNKGILSVHIVIGRSRLNLLWAVIGLIIGKKNISKKLKSFRVKDMTIETRRPVRVSRDGEHERMSSPLQYSLQKSSLWVLRDELI